MLLAELEIRHSRAVAPTRRVALGTHWLPTDPAPGFGGVLLAGIVATYLPDVGPELRTELLALADDLEHGRRIVQPRLRHRFQADIVGLDRSRHALVGVKGEALGFEAEVRGGPAPQLLGAVYAAAALHATARTAVFSAITTAAEWDGDVGLEFIMLISRLGQAGSDFWRRVPTDERWALQILGFGPASDPERDEVQRRFRQMVREQHPDHGGEALGAGQRIVELTQARRILLP